MKSLKSAPLVVLSALLAGSTALSTPSHAACTSCGQTQSQTSVRETSVFNGTRPRVTKQRDIFSGTSSSRKNVDSSDWRQAAQGPIFGSNDCNYSGGPIFGDNTCVTRKCGGAIFGPQTCKKIDLPCENCKQPKTVPVPYSGAPRAKFIQNYKTLPDTTVYEKIHKCSELAPIQLEWVDFRIQDKYSESYSRKLGKYRFRLFGCRRLSKNALLNEGRIIQKDMQFIDIFEDIVNDCYNIVKVPNDLCLREQDYEAPEYILTAEITDYFMNVCDGYNWDNAEQTDKRTGSAEMTVTWRLLDLTKTKVLWKGETSGYSELEEGRYNGEMELIEQAFADAVLNLKGLPEFEARLAQRVSPEVIEQQKTTLLAIEQAADPIKCKISAPQASSCPVPQNLTYNTETSGNADGTGYIEQIKTDGNSQGNGYIRQVATDGGSNGNGYNVPNQCPMTAEMIEFSHKNESYMPLETDTIPLEFGQIPYAENSGSICYGYNNDNRFTDFKANSIGGTSGEGNRENAYPFGKNDECNSALTEFIEPEENACENPMFAETDQDCAPALLSFINAEQECSQKDIEQLIVEESPEICLFAGDVESTGGISKDSGYFIPETEELPATDDINPTKDWQDYTDETEMREPEITLQTCPEGETVELVKTEEGSIVEKVSCRVEPEIPQYACIEHVQPYTAVDSENMYRTRASMMSVVDAKGQISAGLQIADDLILISADSVDENTETYQIETLNGVRNTAKLSRVNLKKNIALLKADSKMYFHPLSLNMDLPPVGQGGFISLGLMRKLDGQSALDDKGTIKGYRFTDQMGTEIITDTFVQSVSTGVALIDEKGVVNGIASHNRKVDDNGDLFLPILDAINSVGLEVCGQEQPFSQPPSAIIKPISTAIDGNTGSKEPAILNKKKRK